VRVKGNNVIGIWVGKSCVNYCVVLNLESKSSFGHLGHIASIATWGFLGSDVSPGDDGNSGTMWC